MPAAAPRIAPEALAAVLEAYPQLGPLTGVLANGLSVNTAACLFETPTGTYFAKRYDPAKRDLAGLQTEHALIRELRAHGFRTPALHANLHGETLTWEAQAPYALFDRARGEDRYRDAPVFAPFDSLEEARSAGGWLARFHLALAHFPRPPAKPFRGITARYRWLLAPSSPLGLAELLAEAPVLEPFLEARPETAELVAYMEARRLWLAPLALGLPVGIVHGDFIKRNLFFEGREVSDVLDFDLWNVGYWVYDLALALLPCGFDWGALARGEAPRMAQVRAFLAGYQAVRPLEKREAAALHVVMETARVEVYLSLVTMSLEQHDDEKVMLFWGFIITLMRWFEDNADWSAGLRECGSA